MKTKTITVRTAREVVLSLLVFLGGLVLAPSADAATVFFDDFEDGDHLGWLVATTGGSGSTGSTRVESVNSSQVASVNHVGSGFHSLSRDFTYVLDQTLSFTMQATAKTGVLTGGEILHSSGGITISFLNLFNSTLGSVFIANATNPGSLGPNSIPVDSGQHDYNASMAEFAAQAGLSDTDAIAKINLKIQASAESFEADDGLVRSSAKVWFDNVTISEVPVVPTTPVDLGGTIKTADGTDICAMVLASGQFMFSCNPHGVLLLTELPREQDGTVKRQIYADGFFPKIDFLTNSSDEAVVMTRSGTCPDDNEPYDPAVVPDSAGMRVDITGKVLTRNSQTPICAMVLANGQRTFSCDGLGSYALNIPLDTNGQFKLQVFADGSAPAIQTFDEFQVTNDVRMARASECQ